MKKQPLLVLEHCEPALSDWLLLEYQHAARIWNNHIVFTRVTKKKDTSILKKMGCVEKGKASDIFANKKGIILDPLAKKPLTHQDCSQCDILIIGGILGYEEPKGRTKKMISDHAPFATRHLGSIQLSIDGSAFVAKAISLGIPLQDIEIASEIEIVHDSVHSTILPFGYPIIDNKPIITPGLIDYLKKI